MPWLNSPEDPLVSVRLVISLQVLKLSSQCHRSDSPDFPDGGSGLLMDAGLFVSPWGCGLALGSRTSDVNILSVQKDKLYWSKRYNFPSPQGPVQFQAYNQSPASLIWWEMCRLSGLWTRMFSVSRELGEAEVRVWVLYFTLSSGQSKCHRKYLPPGQDHWGLVYRWSLTNFKTMYCVAKGYKVTTPTITM